MVGDLGVLPPLFYQGTSSLLKSNHRPASSISPLAPESKTLSIPFADSSAEMRPLLFVMSVRT